MSGRAGGREGKRAGGRVDGRAARERAVWPAVLREDKLARQASPV